MSELTVCSRAVIVRITPKAFFHVSAQYITLLSVTLLNRTLKAGENSNLQILLGNLECDQSYGSSC